MASYFLGSAIRRMRRVHRIVLAQGVPLPVLGQQDAAEVRMPVEDHAQQVVALALHPVGAAIDGGEGGTVRRASGQRRAHEEGEVSGQVLHAAQDFQPLLLPVHRGQPVEVEAAEVRPREGGEGLPLLAGQRDAEGTRRLHGLDAESIPDACGRFGRRHRASGVSVPRRPVFWNSATCAWSWSNPYISESGVGGQTGTYTSTATTRSTPLTT